MSRIPLSQQRPVESIVFRVEGKPQAKERPRFGGGRVFTAKATESYERGVAMAAGQAVACVPWSLDARYHVELAVSYGDRVRRDLDNVAKAVLDGMNGAVWNDDVQVHSLLVERVFDDEPYVDITVHWHPPLVPVAKKPRRKSA